LIWRGWDEFVNVPDVPDGFEAFQVTEYGGRVRRRVFVDPDEEVNRWERVFGLSKV